MAASSNLLPWFETARIAVKCTQVAPAMARLLTMRPSVLERDTHPEEAKRALPRPRMRSRNPASRPPAHHIDRRARARVRLVAGDRKAMLLIEADGAGIVGVDLEIEA